MAAAEYFCRSCFRRFSKRKAALEHTRACDEEHRDIERDGRTCCSRCGYVKPAAGWKSRCKGVVRIALRREGGT
jgi:hypothetical protein